MTLPRRLLMLRAALRTLHWTRGLRAGLAVAGAMLFCRAFHDSIGWAAGWAALGGFEAILVDNGGPYRSRFTTMVTLMLGGTLACVAAAAGTSGGGWLAVLAPMVVTAGFCFGVTFARVATQPIASTSVIILVIYFAALGSGMHALHLALAHALAFVLGAAWAAALSLVLWPVDPFRPARLGVAGCYQLLASFSATIDATERGSESREQARRHAFDWQRQMRVKMEAARAALSATAARAPSRTVRARNLTVLLETADMLLAVTMRATELALALDRPLQNEDLRDQSTAGPDPQRALLRLSRWLSEAEQAIADGLLRRPQNKAEPGWQESCTRGAREVRRLRQPAEQTYRAAEGVPGSVLAHLSAAELDAAQNIEIACESVSAVWSGAEARSGSTRLTTAVNSTTESPGSGPSKAWIDTLRANWTLDSVMMRHALRMMVVGAADVLLLRVLHLAHGFWLAMTSIIVLQPYRSNTLKRGVERVGGTIAGGILAAGLAAVISSQTGILVVVTITSVLTLATYAVDYAWYCFFLTPTFVLLSLPHLRDWQYSGVRMLTTVLGAAVALAAMRLLWPQREHLSLGRLLARAAAADAAYIRTVLDWWTTGRSETHQPSARSPEGRRTAEREVLGPARRACGLASNDAEESLDRLMLEPGFGGLNLHRATPIEEHALTFVTYIRRLTQSTTTLAVLGSADPEVSPRLRQLVDRLNGISTAITEGHRHWEPGTDTGGEQEDSSITLHQLQRMERQVAVLERATKALREVAA